MPARNEPLTIDERLARLEEIVRGLRQFQAAIPDEDTINTTVETVSSGTLVYGSPVSSIFGQGGADGSFAGAAHADHEHDRRTDFVWQWSAVNP